MMRNGTNLGSLEWETKVIHLMGSQKTKFEDDKEFLEQVRRGEFIKCCDEVKI